VTRQLGKRVRRAALFEIDRRRANDLTECPELANDQAGIDHRADAAEALNSEFEVMRLKPPSSGGVADGLYVSSAVLGRVAIVFVAATEGPEAVAAAFGSAESSVLVSAREVVNLWEERGRLAALDQNASARNGIRVELNGRLNDLQQEHDRLVWAVQHAQPAESTR